MKPAPFDYHAPRTLDSALTLLGRLGDGAKLLAGGQSLMPLLNMRLARPAALIDLNRVSELFTVAASDGELRLGAMVSHLTLEQHPLIRD
jgi:carbon-monoxide dehydrogenase medium subunit